MAAFDRSALVALLLDSISDADIYVGDHYAPKEGGWSTGMPGTGVFTSYVVLATGQVTMTVSLMVPGKQDASAQFEVRCYGATREQADDLSMKVWSALTGYKATFGDYRINMVWRRAIGAAQRIDATDPKFWSVTDSYVVECVPIS
jgi:hypothetical protein